MNKTNQEFSVWPLMIDMLTSILIIFILLNFFNNLLNPKELEQVVIDIKRKQFVEKFDKGFAKEISEKTISREGKFDYLKITFSDRVLFEPGEHQLGKNGRRILDKLSPLFKLDNTKRDFTRIQVEGHTDSSPMEKNKTTYPRNNMELSSARALSVVDYLFSLGVSQSLFSANGYGPNDPVRGSDGQVSRDLEKHRRVEIKVYFLAE